jgi:hypothetical protein
MNKLFILCGMVFLGVTSTPQEDTTNELHAIHFTASTDFFGTDFTLPTEFREASDLESPSLLLSAIPYSEVEEEIDLGFDTSEYLPDNFDPSKVYVNFNELPYYEVAKAKELENSFLEYLPANFNAYAIPENFMDIAYMEEEDIDLGFDTKPYLPARFDAYTYDLDLSTIVYIEEEDLKYGYYSTNNLPLIFIP